MNLARRFDAWFYVPAPAERLALLRILVGAFAVVYLVLTWPSTRVFRSGQTKLRNAGIDWLDGENLRNYVAYDNLRKIALGDPHSPLAGWLVPHAWLFTPLAFFTLDVELGAPLALLQGGIARVWVCAAWLFHGGILALMAIVFPYPLAGVAFAPFLPIERGRLPRSVRISTRALSRG